MSGFESLGGSQISNSIYAGFLMPCPPVSATCHMPQHVRKAISRSPENPRKSKNFAAIYVHLSGMIFLLWRQVCAAKHKPGRGLWGTPQAIPRPRFSKATLAKPIWRGN
jgi:hypothetical protein